ncbi:MAG: TonB-dependent receptor, partial [Bacteroidota bacterium]|nr:TonB-dependent receptor [Bacteroidota bacterium]
MQIKKFIRVFTLTFLFLAGGRTVASAQTQTIVTGTVLANKSPLEYATVILYQVPDTNKMISAAVTDSLGHFSFKDLPFGSYVLKTTIQGYLPHKSLITVDSLHQNLTLPEMELLPDVPSLKAVVVTAQAQKSLLKKTTNGFIINAGSNLTQATGTATDLLRNTPTVVVDEEGTITIRGKTPLILVNGRNSNLAATDRIPASSVESIEIINNPSAKYDAEAEGGIINIILKKNRANGTNGSVALGGGYGARGRISSAVLINHQKGKWNTGLAYDNRFANRTRGANAERINFRLPEEYYLLQNRHDLRLEQTQNLKLNVDFTPNKNNAFNLEMIGNLSGEDNHETLVSLFEKQNSDFNYKNSRHSDEFERGKALEGAFTYSKKFEDKRKTLSAGVTSSFDFDRENTDITTQSLDISDLKIGNPFLQRTHDYQNSNVSNLTMDFSRPLGKKGIMEMGYKGIIRATDADFQSLYHINNEYVPNPQASSLFKFREQVHAAYVTYRNAIDAADAPKVKYDLGIRGEQVWNRGHTATSSLAFQNNYFHLFPSATIAFYFKETDFLKLNYSRRINRPGLGQLNPFIDITDSLNPHGGNPYLKPELVSSVELGYNREGAKFSSVSNLFYRYATNIIRPFISLDTNGVALVVPRNYGNAITYGFEEIFSAYPAKLYNCNASVSLFQQHINGANVSSDALSNYFSWYAKLINNLTLGEGSKLQLIANYNSPIATPQGTRIAVYHVDGGFQQKLFKGKAAIGLVITDIFNTQRSGFTAVTADFNYYR